MAACRYCLAHWYTMSAFGTGTLFAPSHMESRSIAGVVLSALAAAALAGYAGFGFYDKQYGISSLAVAAMLVFLIWRARA